MIDSVAGICGDFVNNSQGAPGVNIVARSIFIKKIITTLKTFAYKYNIVILVANNMSSSIGEDNDDYKKEKVDIF